MAEPDPSGVEPGESWPNSVPFYTWPCGNKRHRKARAQRIMQNARRGGGEWSCRECGEPVAPTPSIAAKDAARKPHGGGGNANGAFAMNTGCNRNRLIGEIGCAT